MAGPASTARALRPALEQPSQPTPLTRGRPLGSVIKHHVFQVLWVPVSGGKTQNGFKQRREDPFSASLFFPLPRPTSLRVSPSEHGSE